MKKVTLNDIAKELGVSTGLVSMVVNGKAKQNRIRKEVAKIVMDKAVEMNYQPNQFARGLKTGRSNIIGLIVADIANPFFGKLARAVEDYASKHKLNVMFCSSDERAEKSNNLIKILLDRQVDGLILAPTIDSQDQILFLKRLKVPFVLIDRFFPEIESHRVIVNNWEGSYKAVNYLIHSGAKNIGYVNISSGLWNMKQRFEGYKKALNDAGMVYRPKLYAEIKYALINEDIQKKIHDLIHENQNMDALFFSSNILGVHGIQVLKSLRKRIPEDIAVVCFDDPEHYSLAECGITTLSQPIQEMSRKAVNLLVETIENKGKAQNYKQIQLSTQFIIRDKVDLEK